MLCLSTSSAVECAGRVRGTFSSMAPLFASRAETVHVHAPGECFPKVRRGSPAAMAPEVLSAFAAATWPGVWRGGAGAAPVRPDAPDMWAAGCMLAQLLATGIAVRC